jgi:hypothetical protein
LIFVGLYFSVVNPYHFSNGRHPPVTGYLTLPNDGLGYGSTFFDPRL